MTSTSKTSRFSMLKPLLVGASIMLASGASTSIASAPEPSPVEISWEFTFDLGPLRMAWVESEGVTQPYFFLTYQITNFSGEDLLFVPNVQMVTDNVEVTQSGAGVSTAVTKAITESLDNPLVESQIDIVSTVLQGPENARDGVLIWPANTLDADEIAIYFEGLSGEREIYTVGLETDNPRRHVLNKTLMLRYETPGEFADQGARPFELAERRWVMR